MFYLQGWIYDPLSWGRGARPSPFPVALTLRDVEDERLQAALFFRCWKEYSRDAVGKIQRRRLPASRSSTQSSGAPALPDRGEQSRRASSGLRKISIWSSSVDADGFERFGEAF